MLHKSVLAKDEDHFCDEDEDYGHTILGMLESMRSLH